MAIATALAIMAVTPAVAQDRPNILVIFPDDVGWQNVSAYGRGTMGYTTPNIDRIADEGVMFTDHYAQPSCTAGRAAFITGQYPIRSGMTTVGRPGATLGDIGHAIQVHVEKHRFSVVRDFCGHGIGRHFHEPPNILHFGRPGEGPKLKPGMFFTVEPMVNAGRPEVKILDDGWTAVTRDRSLSAQFEHMVAVTDNGVEIFTLSPKGMHKPPYSG
jgi:hypothetical protein